MQGASRSALAESREALAQALSQEVDRARLGEELNEADLPEVG